jgi:hypothetical protein
MHGYFSINIIDVSFRIDSVQYSYPVAMDHLLLRRCCCPLHYRAECVETIIHYDIYGLQVNRLLTNMDGLMDGLPPATPFSYYDSAQKSPLFF